MNIKPFVYGMSVEGEHFTDRELETKRLKLNFENGINSILISPRRMGKTSLVKKVMGMIDAPQIKVVYMDIYKCRTEFDFYDKFASAIIQATASKIDAMVENAKKFITSFTPKLSFSPDLNAEFTLSLGLDKNRNSAEEVLNLPEKIAREKGIHIVVCIDEFQQIGEIPNSLSVQRAMRSVWQHQQNVTYCMFGSKKHLMENFFNHKSMPFYKFGDMMFLKKIPTNEWISFISDKFTETGKKISPKQITRICDVTENQSSYVQHLSWIVWYKSGKTVTEEDIEQSIDDLLEQNKVFFQREVEQLTELQMNFLRALANNITTGFSSKEVIRKYRLESSANVNAIKKALIKKDIIDVDGQRISFNDALFRLWIQRQQFFD